MEMTDSLARIILLIGFAAVMPIGVYYRLPSITDERLDRRQEGWPILLSLRLFALACMIGLVAYVVEPTDFSGSTFWRDLIKALPCDYSIAA